ncbi:MAG: threonylcarbamoyl-AMP synthase [Planctomycetota bacterium]|nr:MAG: threonylcarbamoyl-AMP synthase [Planctomycetota bacterium]REJ87435.1 MAG: threonylcarbamoyl-AMP synthase [Planctomycetota bacterium]REK30773.1 MAG: threonylcarbamoyl-AMP synthase [Planctomycetota bacterium]REK42153.1 MAG: threonylcarbamoyl-AMP synthase [Planctomycetota bacterium]
MNPVVIDIRAAEDARDVVHRAVQTLVEGRLVAFPTETVYGLAASALSADAVSRLLEAKGRREGHPLALAVKSADDALDYVPDLGTLGRRLARRCWPGPVTLVADNSHPDSLIPRLPEAVQQAIVPSGTVGLRVPAHDLILEVLRMMAGPIALSSANLTGGDDPFTAEQVVEQLGERVDLVLDDGRTRFAQASTVVRVHDREFQILREGVVNEATLKRLSSLMLLVVCTGNTCRSPMAERLARQQIAERLGCRLEELEDRSVIVMSAGIASGPGGAPSPHAVEVMKSMGLDLSDHRSQPVREQLVRHADLILTMTRGHHEAIVSKWPEAAGRTHLLCRDGGDVADPIGGPVELYRACAQQMATELSHWIDELPL